MSDGRVKEKGTVMSDAYDYIICGAGSAGCVLANRLSEDPEASVLLIEAGPTHNHWSVKTPGLALVNMVTKKRNWAFETIPQKGLNGRKGYQPRGKVLGGSSGTNAMIYIRGHKADYDHWESQGNAGWGYEDVLPYFRKSENYERGGDGFHGTGGPLNVTRRADISPINSNFLEATRELQIPQTEDFNGANQEGAGIYDVTQKRGVRWSTAKAFLEPAMERENLEVVTGALVEKVIVDSGRATGVQLRTKAGTRTVSAREEVIVSAGAFGSPHILLLSGIGAKDKLAPHGIDQVHELPGVGENLHDHIDWISAYRAKDGSLKDKTVGFSIGGGFGMLTKQLSKYRKEGTGLFATNIAESGAFLTIDKDAPSPDIQIHFCIALVDDHGRKLHWGHGYSAHVCVLRPKSRGRVTLQSADPKTAPQIDPAFLEDDRDMELLYKAARLTQRIMQAPAMDPIRGEPMYGTDAENEAELREDIRNRADTVYHPVGTCKMGSDAMAVVDDRLRVHGLEGLRVADASIMPQVVSGNTNAPTIMIAEKAADMIRDDRMAKQRVAAQ